jgi:hypothetical protein
MKTNRQKSADKTQIRISMNEYMYRVSSNVQSRSWNDMGLGNYAFVLHLGTMRSSFTWELCVRPSLGNYAFVPHLGTMHSAFTWELCVRPSLGIYAFVFD